MTKTFSIEQAIYRRVGTAEPELLAKSPGFAPEWRAMVQRILIAFGARPVGIACPSAVFAQPLGRGHVMVVHVADLDAPGMAERPVGLHVVVLPRDMYTQFWHDPFLIAERVVPDWRAQGDLPSLTWPAEPLPVRTVEQVREVLQRIKGPPLSEEELGEEQIEQHRVENSLGPALLGGVQALVDGGQLVFHRPAPDTELVKALWMLLPNSSRGEIWPASFAFSNELRFDILVVPRFNVEDYQGYTTEDLAADYPEGHYEYNLQKGAEAGDQHELNILFERRSLKQTWRIGILLLIGVTLAATLSRFYPASPPRPVGPAPNPGKIRTSLASAMVGETSNPLNALSLVPLTDEDTWKEVTNIGKKDGS